MATYGWREGRSVAEALFAEGERFSFYQAVRLLERLYADRVPVAEDVDPEREVARFSSNPSLAFPATEVRSLRPPQDGGPVRMEVNFMGLAGALGPLPRSFAELIYDRSRRRDTSPRDFLDIFNHRLVSLFFRGRKKYRPALDGRPPQEGRVAGCVHSLIGLGTPGLRGRMGVQDRALLHYSSLLAGNHRSMVGLARLVAGYFGVAAEVEPFRGAWRRLDEDQLSRIGVGGQYQRLGEAVLGGRFWDQQAGFVVRLGPLRYRRFLSFLPSGAEYGTLCALVRFYAGDDLDFDFRLVLLAAEVPETRLGRAGDVRLGWSARLDRGGPAEPRLGSSGGSRMGWTSWLRRRAPERDAEALVRGPR